MYEKVLQAINYDRIVPDGIAICDIHSPTGSEQPAAEWLADKMRELGMRVSFQFVEDGRPNVVGVLEGTGGGRSLMFNGHLDTSYPFLLGISGRSALLTEPIPATVDGEWLYGNGIDNMKAAFPCYLAAVEAIVRSGARPRGDILISGVVGEVESAPVTSYEGPRYRGHGQGARYLVTHGALADYCVLGEPLNLGISVANCGAVWAEIKTHGPVMGSYVSKWEDNAIVKMARLIPVLETWAQDYRLRHAAPDVSPAVTIIATEGGWAWRAARTPQHCSLFVDVRTNPDEPLAPVMRELKEVVRSAEPADSRFPATVDYFATIPGSRIDPSDRFTQAVQAVHTSLVGEPAPYRVSPATNDRSTYVRYGMPTVVYGPGGARRPADEGGSINEYVRIANMHQCAQVYARTALEVCNWTD